VSLLGLGHKRWIARSLQVELPDGSCRRQSRLYQFDGGCDLLIFFASRVVKRRRAALGRRQLLTDEERRLLLGVPGDADSLARHYTFTRQ
jgi:hypothetical protein